MILMPQYDDAWFCTGTITSFHAQPTASTAAPFLIYERYEPYRSPAATPWNPPKNWRWYHGFFPRSIPLRIGDVPLVEGRMIRRVQQRASLLQSNARKRRMYVQSLLSR